MKARTVAATAAALVALAVGSIYSSRALVRAMDDQQEASGLVANLAYWTTVVPGLVSAEDAARTRLAVAHYRQREESEMADLPELQQRAERFQQRVAPWLAQPPVQADGRLSAVALQAQTQMLADLVRLPAEASRTALADRLAAWLAQVLDAPASRSSLPALQQLRTAEALAMHAARSGHADAAQHWLEVARTAVPRPADIKAHTVENTARDLLPLHVMLASCLPGQTPLLAPEAQQALAHGYDIRQLRQQYTASWDRPLLQLAAQPGTAPICSQTAARYKALLVADQP
ncbi:MAG: hypothetical protein AB7V34_01520 [Brachymonas sp.]